MIFLSAFLVLFCLGLITGSYLNSWIWRYKSGQWQFPKRSICVHCAKELNWQDNIPIFSFLLLKGKCRFCNQPIPKEYIWVEFAGGFILAAIGLHAMFFGISELVIFRNIFFGFLLLVIFVYDAKYLEIPSGVVWAGTVVALVTNLLILQSSITDYRISHIAYRLSLGIAIGGGFFLAQYVISKGRWIGGGDVRLGVLMGALLGWPGVALAIGISYVLGALYAIPLLLAKKKTAQEPIAFGTFLAVGTLVVMLFEYRILNWYLGMVRW